MLLTFWSIFCTDLKALLDKFRNLALLTPDTRQELFQKRASEKRKQ